MKELVSPEDFIKYVRDLTGARVWVDGKECLAIPIDVLEETFEYCKSQPAEKK